MSNITCVLDACTIINLIHIDENDFILKRLKQLDIFICETVFKEVVSNVYAKIEKLKRSEERDIDIEERRKKIDISLSFFRNFQVLNKQIIDDFGVDFFDMIGDHAEYKKRNGEFYSTALSIYLTATIPTKLFFHTDDFPAKNTFSKFFSFQQIGLIEDTSDLLVLLYRIDETFSLNQLDKLLSSLFSEYASEVAALEKRLLEIKTELPINLRRDRNLVISLNNLIEKLSKYNFSGINDLRNHFYENKNRNKIICEVLELYSNVFHLENESSDFLKKISELRNFVKKVYCFI